MSNEKSSSGISLIGLLGVAFVVLKLCKVIDWSWWWVTLPFWGGIAIVLIILVLAGMGFVAAKVTRENTRKNDRVKYPMESKWEARLREIRDQQIAKRKQNAPHN